MSESTDEALPIVVGRVSVFDRTKASPLPFEQKGIKLVWSRCGSQTRSLIRGLLPPKANRLDLAIGETHVEMSFGDASSPFPLHQLRPHFDRISINELVAITMSGNPLVTQLFFSHEYIETENGNPISMCDVFSHLHGDEKPLLLGNLESVRRLGPNEIRDVSKWDPETGRMLLHFLRLVRFLSRTSWAREPIKISFSQDPQSNVNPKAQFPQFQSFALAAPFLRQLYDNKKSDNVLRTATSKYLSLCDHGGKSAWLDYELQLAQGALDSEPFGMKMPGVLTGELFEILLYGSRLLHAKPMWGADRRAHELISKYGAHTVAFAAHSGFRQYFYHCAMAASLIEMDFQYWTQVQKLPVADDDVTGVLFGQQGV